MGTKFDEQESFPLMKLVALTDWTNQDLARRV